MKSSTNNLENNRIKILFIIPGAGQGGAETQLLSLVRGIDKSKFKVFLGVLYGTGVLKKEFDSLAKNGVEVIDFGKKSSIDIIVFHTIAQFIKKQEISLIQAFITNHSAYIPVFISGRGLAIGGIRDSFSHDHSFSDKLVHFHLPKWVVKLGKYVMISNSNTAKKLYAKKGIRDSSITVIPNGIDYKKFSRGNKNHVVKELNLKGKKVIIFVGRLIDTKNHIPLIDAFKRHIFHDKKNILLLAGDGPMKEKIAAKIKEEHLEEQIKMLGNRKDIADILKSGNIFVFPSSSEAWPNVIGEAMAAGLAVVSYNAGDVSDIIENGVDGIIVENMEELTAKTSYLLKNPKKAITMGKKASINVRKKFSVESMIKNYEKAYIGLYQTMLKK